MPKLAQRCTSLVRHGMSLSRHHFFFAAVFVAAIAAFFLRHDSLLPGVAAIAAVVALIRIEQLIHSQQRLKSLTQIAVTPDFAKSVDRILHSTASATRIRDPLHRQLLSEQLKAVTESLKTAQQGQFEFHGTEQWRSVYSELLQNGRLHVYRSVSLCRDDSYWQSEAGRKSTELNLELSESGRLSIERIVILSDDLWPDTNTLPTPKIQEWLIEQHHRGVTLFLARESELAEETDLIVDMGIYGSRAVGFQQLDSIGKTRKFTLQFGLPHVELAEQLWQRLLVHAVKYADFLDRYSINA